MPLSPRRDRDSSRAVWRTGPITSIYKTPVDLREHWKIARNVESTPTGQMGTCSCKYVFTCTRLLSGRLGGYFVKKHDTALSQIGRRTADGQPRRVLFSFFLFIYAGIQERHRRPYGELFSLRGASLNLGHILKSLKKKNVHNKKLTRGEQHSFFQKQKSIFSLI